MVCKFFNFFHLIKTIHSEPDLINIKIGLDIAKYWPKYLEKKLIERGTLYRPEKQSLK